MEEAPKGGFTARALGFPIFTEADTAVELHAMVRDAVACHGEEGTAPAVLRLPFVRDEVTALGGCPATFQVRSWPGFWRLSGTG